MIPWPLPRVTAVPLKSMLSRSAISASSETTSDIFATGTDSPVSADSFACRRDASMSRRSAVMTSPPSTTTTSPGTSSSASTRTASPSRSTTDSTFPSSRSASIDRTARSSVKNPIAALIRITTAMAMPSRYSAKAKARPAPMMRRPTRRLANWSTRMRQAGLRFACRSSLRPNSSRRRRTASSSSPRSGSTSSCRAISSASIPHGAFERSKVIPSMQSVPTNEW